MAALLGAVTLMGAAQAAGVPNQGTWETTLKPRDLDGILANGPEAFYDTDLNITWLRAGNTYGAISGDEARAWAKQTFFGLKGWRLPNAVDKGGNGCDWSNKGGTDCGYNPDSSVATGSEMAHLFFQSLGNKSYYIPGTTTVQTGYGLTNTGNFQTLWQPGVYWAFQKDFPDMDVAWIFDTEYGMQQFKGFGKNDPLLYALAVRDGDVTEAVPVPEPQTYALMLAGLGLMGFAARRRSSNKQ
ncbi:PEPxxWA-CTERM sorting domain-containing protein [Paucibacter sp. TC2R-5]|uniref:PEP-CTERM sorting domain-containing protein n=1 Tax=Paucibacter sp. TC2R-5 TaxID=2893555 RepID=UPI0021E470DB|nr:PEP-CTERM sorting domain-containing protein [Paucibacter sp. TC2R-5]MCV2360001.1 PEPxxWA-CTERM sorting domain-containing protein [Paucibacter sp. TC2R-5]